MFTHGTYASEKESSIKGIVEAKNPICVIGTAPINMGDINSVNRVEVIQNAKDAVAKFGTSKKIKGFTISEAIHVGLNIFGVVPIVCINVLDPTRHKTTYNYQDLVVKEKKVILEHTGILLETLEIKRNDTDVPITEFTTYFNQDGTLTVELTGEEETTQIKGQYEYLDPTKVTHTDIIGSIDPITLKATGLECLKDIFSKYSMIPKHLNTQEYLKK